MLNLFLFCLGYHSLLPSQSIIKSVNPICYISNFSLLIGQILHHLNMFMSTPLLLNKNQSFDLSFICGYYLISLFSFRTKCPKGLAILDVLKFLPTHTTLHHTMTSELFISAIIYLLCLPLSPSFNHIWLPYSHTLSLNDPHEQHSTYHPVFMFLHI